jgi:fructosamine-3-kinase
VKITERVAGLLGRGAVESTPVRGGSICRSYRVELGEGEAVFAKHLHNPPAGLFTAEARGLAWLGDAGSRPGAEGGSTLVPEVLASDEDLLVLTWIEPGHACREGAERFGRALATLHAAGSSAFGAPWPGYIGSLPMSNADAEDWPTFYARSRVLPYLRAAADADAITAGQVRAVEAALERVTELAGPPEPPSRIHGDLWAGNVVWDTCGEAWLVDPAAHGGHRETDLAMLALFGAPFLERIVASYREAYPLADGYQDRVGLHQLHPLLVHAVLFGGGYGAQAASAARRLLGGR